MKVTAIIAVAMAATGCTAAAVADGDANASNMVEARGGPTPNGTFYLLSKRDENGTTYPPAKREEDPKSAGDYYNGAAPTAATSSFTQDSSKISQTSKEFGPAMTDTAGKKVTGGASSMAAAGGLVLGLAVLTSSILMV